jgi:hypothetical protein
MDRRGYKSPIPRAARKVVYERYDDPSLMLSRSISRAADFIDSSDHPIEFSQSDPAKAACGLFATGKYL